MYLTTITPIKEEITMTMNNKEEKNLLTALYGSAAFVKIKQCLEIGKIQFSFVDLKNGKNHIDCYMEAEEFGAILMNSIKDKSLIKAILNEKAKGEQYPKAVYTSPVGGNATGNDGKPISRYFEISPASKGEVLFTAYAFPAEKNDKGAFIKLKGSKSLLTLRIPCTFKDLYILSYKWSFLEHDYMTKKYTLENMKSDYHVKPEDAQTYPDQMLESDTSKPMSSDDDYISGNDDVPCVGTTPSNSVPAPAAKTKTVKLTATSEMVQLKGKKIKVCKVNLADKEKRLICLTDKFVDQKRLSDFENQLKDRIAQHKTLEFKGEICEKGNDLYLCKFA